MSIMVGTIVTRYASLDKEFSCVDGACVGRIQYIVTNLDHPEVTVRWMQTCNFHNYSLHAPYYYRVDQLWEIGQIPQALLD